MSTTSSSVKRLTSAATPAPQGGEPPEKATFLSWLRRAYPTMLVLVALAAIAVVGHQTGWSIPKFSELFGKGNGATDDWCAEHSVPESICVECQKDLSPKPPTFGWCKTHGVHDCPLEHPEVAQLKVPPKITKADLERAQRALNFTDRPENSKKCKLHPRRLQVASEATLKKLGMEFAPVWEAPMEESVTANGEITYHPRAVATLGSPLAGKIWRVEKDLGQPVKKGDVVALVDAVEVGRAKIDFLKTLSQLNLKTQTLERIKPLVPQGVMPEARFQEIQTEAREAQIHVVSAQQVLVNLGLPIRADDVKGMAPEELARRVQFLGLPYEVVKTLDGDTTTANLIPIKAPLDGVVVFRKGVAGDLVDPSKTLFVVADPTRMLVTLNVRLEDAKALAEDQTVRFRPEGGKEEVTGVIAAKGISTQVDERTRTVQVRADLTNANGKLRSNTFGAGRIVLRREPNAIVVPSEAIHWDGNCHVVFVQDKNFHEPGGLKVFHVRSVRPGARDEKHTEIIAGMLPGEVVVTQGSAILRAELLKNNLGEG